LEAALVDQLLATREFELTGSQESLRQADSLGTTAAQTREGYLALLRDTAASSMMDDTAAQSQLSQIAAGQTQVQRDIASAQARIAAGDIAGARDTMKDAGLKLRSVS